MSASHRVQSVRAVVEQTIADLKLAKVLFGNKINAIVSHEKELDCVIGLHNLRVLLKTDPQFDIPRRRNALVDEHIFKPLMKSEELDLKIPLPITPKMESEIAHIRRFEEFLSSASPAIGNALETGGKECVFYPTVGKRGRNLYNGAYVLQLRLQEELMECWTIKYLVGASYSYELHTGYFQMSKDDAAKAHICDCYAG